MKNKDYILYLNSLHNYNAKNSNSYCEKNIKNEFYDEVMVKVELTKHLVNIFKKGIPCTIILTGHAGDGKTSIMHQVLKELDLEIPDNSLDMPKFDVDLASNTKCRCIKDFSEISENDKIQILQEALNMPSKGNFAFVVANTGPLINTFGQLFNEDIREEKKIELIGLMDINSGKNETIGDYKVSVINVANIDNTYFAEDFVEKITQDNLWGKCKHCCKNSHCHILNNRNLIKNLDERVLSFLKLHYRWLAEHGRRLTIRSISEQLVYMITGGYNCENVVNSEEYNLRFNLLFTNLFFGYIGLKENVQSHNIVAVKEAFDCMYDRKRLHIDEDLLISRDYNKFFTDEILEIIKSGEQKYLYLDGWDEFIKRLYIFLNKEKKENYNFLIEDIFSRQFNNFLEITSGNTEHTSNLKKLITNALSMIYIGIPLKHNQIPITLSRDTGITQNVQLVIGTINSKQLKINTSLENVFLGSDSDNHSTPNRKYKKYNIHLKIDDKELRSVITLPLINYFEDLKNGIISTDIDPQLSHGIETLKAELYQEVGKSDSDDSDDDSFDMIIMNDSDIEFANLSIADEKIKEN